MSFPRYEKTKDSGVEWLGQVPEHWRLDRLKWACEVFPSNVDKKTYDDERSVSLCNYTDVYRNDLITDKINFMIATATDDQIKKFQLRRGDTIITKDSEDRDDIAVSAYVPEDMPGVICGYHLAMVRPLPSTYGGFVKRSFESTYAKSCFAILANGLTRYGLGQHEIDNVLLPFPPFVEQKLISDFLDRETAKIDALIAEQQRLIELLKEKRQAVISHAVTKGLYPDAPMKPSGIEWLGDVPEHWEEFPLSALFAIKHGFAFDGAEFTESGNYILMTPGNFHEEGGFRSKNTEKFYAGTNIPIEFILQKGQLLLAMTEQAPGLLGSALFVPDGSVYLHNQRLGLIKNIKNEKIYRYFIYYICNSPRFRAEINVSATGVKVKHTSPQRILSVKVWLPPLTEQQQIVRFLIEENAKFESLTLEAYKAIDLLQERRSALISAAVTGKIDVRGLVDAEAV